MTSRKLSITTKCLIAIQLALGLVVIGATAVIPAPGQAALYLPLAGGASRAVAFAAQKNSAILARGPYTGSLVLRAPDSRFAFAALASGALPLAVPLTTCAPSATPSNRT